MRGAGLCVGGGASVRGAYTWSNRSVKKRWTYLRGELIHGVTEALRKGGLICEGSLYME